MPEKVSTAAYPDDEMPVRSRGSYNLDFDDLDNINPFQSSAQLQNSPGNLQKPSGRVSNSPEKPEKSPDSLQLDEPAPASTTASTEHSSEEKVLSSGKEPVLRELECDKAKLSPKQAISDSVQDVRAASPDVSQTDNSAEVPTPPVQLSGSLGPSSSDVAGSSQTGGLKLQVVSVSEKVSTEESKPAEGLSVSKGEPAEKPSVTKAEPVKLEFDFDNTTARKPPPKKLGKRPGIKPPSKKIPIAKPKPENAGVQNQKIPMAKPENTEVQNQTTAEDEIPIPKASYKLDWDKLDDPNFNPFGGGSKISSSNECSQPDPQKAQQEEQNTTSSREPHPVEQEKRLSACETLEKREPKNL